MKQKITATSSASPAIVCLQTQLSAISFSYNLPPYTITQKPKGIAIIADYLEL
jgi:hypothetical protein